MLLEKVKTAKAENKDDVLELKNQVRLQLIQQNLEFVEMHSEFPYFLDFANLKDKWAVIVDDEKEYLEVSGRHLYTGNHSLRVRQLKEWKLKVITLESFLSTEF